MEGTYVAVMNRRAVYVRKKDLQIELGISRGTADKLFKGVQEGISSGRYDPYVIAGNHVNFYAVIDFMKYGDQLKDKNMKKHVPRYSPDRIAECCGYNTRRVAVE